MNALKDSLRSQLEGTRRMKEDGKSEKLEPDLVQTILEAINDERLERLQALENPLCVGPTTNDEILFVDEKKRDLYRREDPTKTSGEYVQVREQALNEGVRLLTPIEARLIERATQEDFTPYSFSFATSLLESEGYKFVFSTHPTWEYDGGHFVVANAGGSHIQFRDMDYGAWTRRGVSLPIELPEKKRQEPEGTCIQIESILEGYKRRFSNKPVIQCQTGHPTEPSSEWHMDWPSIESMRATLRQDETRLSRMGEPFIQKLYRGEIEIVNLKEAVVERHADADKNDFQRMMGHFKLICQRQIMYYNAAAISQLQPFSSRMGLIQPGEWRLAH